MTFNFSPSTRFLFAAVLTVIVARGADVIPPRPPHPLVWEAMELSVAAKAEEKEVKFQFHVTNTSDQPVEVIQIEPSCGCTVAEMPNTPWILAAGAKSSFSAVVDIQGKHGKLSKTLQVHSNAGSQMLRMSIDVPDTEESRRERNQQMAFVDRQAVFRGDCASCHVLPAVGKSGAELFQVACGICHLANPRANMVPDLTVVREPRDAAFWQRWISDGKERTLMPAFASKQGGPLTAGQIASLVEYAMQQFPAVPRQE